MSHTPTIGRIVHYNPGHADPTFEMAAAIVTQVWGPECVNLKVMPDGGQPYDVTSVEMRRPHEVPETPRRWWWPERV